MAWDESKHPRVPQGNRNGGEFTKRAGYSSTESDVAKITKAINMCAGEKEPTIFLHPEEYKMVMSELATNLTKEEHSQPTAVRHIRNYTYRVEIISFGHYRVIGKWKIRAKRRKNTNGIH